MKKNMSNEDRLIRVLLAVVFSALYFTGTVTGALGAVLMVFGGVLLAVAVIGFCPLYALVGINTCSKK